MVLHHGVDTCKFNSNGPKKIKSKKILIGSFSRLDKGKGVDITIEALNKLHKQGYEFKFIISGIGPQRNYLESLANKYNIDTEFLGFVKDEDLPSYIRSCDIIILSSFSEGFANIILEAMASGVCVISSDVGGAPEIIKQYKNGVLYKVGDVNDLYKKLKYLFENKKLIQKIKRNAREFIEKNYTWEKHIKIWEKMLKEVIK